MSKEGRGRSSSGDKQTKRLVTSREDRKNRQDSQSEFKYSGEFRV